MNRHTLYFLLGAAVLIFGGALAYRYYYDYFVLMRGIGVVQEIQLQEHLIMSVSIGTGILVCTSGSYLLFRAFRLSRRSKITTMSLFVMLVLASEFIPWLLMQTFQMFLPDLFHGDRGWDYLFAVAITLPFLVVIFIAFIIGMLFCRRSRAGHGA